MKTTTRVRILSALLALMMLISFLPQTAFAEEVIEVGVISLKGIAVPKAGDRIEGYNGVTLTESIAGSARYRIPDNAFFSWKDDAGRAINGAQAYFEPGRTYSISILAYPKDGFAFKKNATAELYNLYPYQYASEVSILENGTAKITFRFTVAGEQTYTDITQFTFYKLEAPKDGDQAWPPALDFYSYNNSELTDCYWADGNGNRMANGAAFTEGNYSLNLLFTAFDGYHFAEELSFMINNDWAYPNYALNGDRTEVSVRIPYAVTTSSTVSKVTVNGMFLPTQGGDTRQWDSNTQLSTPENADYTIPNQTKGWYEVEAEYPNETEYLVEEKGFFAGKQYKMFLVLHAEDGYKFTSPENLSLELTDLPTKSYTYTCRYSGGEDIVTFTITFTAQFPEGYGSHVSTPVWCNSFIELKTALENRDLRYVALGNVKELLPRIPHNEEEEPSGIDNVDLIVVRGKKDLNLLGDAEFTSPITLNYDLKAFKELIILSDLYDADLYIHGPGSLTFNSSFLFFYNSAIKVIGGRLCIDGATVVGGIGTHNGYCYGINAVYGQVAVQGGGTVRGEVYDGDGICALSLGDEGFNGNLSVSIWDGNFYVDRVIEDGNHDHGIWVNQKEVGLRIYGATMDGFRIRPKAQPQTLADFVQDGCVMTVNGTKTDPASHSIVDGKTVEIYQAITDLELQINSPVQGDNIPIYVENVYGAPDGCTVKFVNWLEDDGKPATSQFQAGKRYKVEIGLTAENGARFIFPLDSATVNFKNATVQDQSTASESAVLLTLDFGQCPATVGSVALTIDPPKQNGKPDQSAASGSSTYKQAPAGVNVFDAPLQWQESQNGTNWTVMDLNDTFTVGYHYRVFIDVMPVGNYLFALDPQLDPDVSATLNGHTATVSRYPEEDPEKLISICYNFGLLNDNIIEQIDIDGVAEPVVGENPNYGSAVSGSGYTLNTAYSNGTYIINGLGWYDKTDDVWMRPNKTFQIGHEYTVYIDVKTESGYEFYTTHVGSSYKPAGWGYINDNYATFGVQSDGRFEQTLSWTFTCQPKTVKSVGVTGLEIPVDGFTPDYAAHTDSDYYTVESIEWYDYTRGIDMTESDTFIGGNEYWVRVTVVPNKEDGNRLCTFVNDKTTATLNGIEVKKLPNNSWQEVVSAPRAVQIFYTFKQAAMEPYCYVSGQLTVSKDVAAPTILQLIPIGSAHAAYEITVGSQATDYYFPNVAVGNYTLRATKDGHIPGEYLISVSESMAGQDFTLYQWGDVDLNNSVNTADVTALLQILAGHPAPDYTLPADLDQNGKLSVADAVILARVLTT